MFKYSVVFVICFLATVNAFPAQDNKKDQVEEVEFVPLEKQKPHFPFGFDGFGRQPVVDTGYFPTNPFTGFGGGFRDYFSDVFKQMNERLHFLFRRMQTLNDTDVDSVGGLHIHGFDLSKADNSSVTEIVNGHKVIINKTEYNNDDDDFHVRIQVINVAPVDEDTPNPNAEEVTPKSTATPEISDDNRESLEDTENEISKQSKEVDNYDIETLDEVDNKKAENKYKNIESMEDIETNQQIVDLTNDILVNQYMADAGQPTDPGAEILDEVDMRLRKKSENYGVLIK